MPKKPTQKQLILDYIDKFGSITPMEAFSDLGITKLATRVSEMIHEDGIEFYKDQVDSVNRFGKKVSYTRYTVIGGRD